MSGTAAPTLTADDWRDLAWLLAVLDDWLLIAEPGTVRELSAFLRSVGATATSAEVISRLSSVRNLVLPPCAPDASLFN